MREGRKIRQILATISATGLAFATGIVLGWNAPMASQAVAGNLGFEITEDEFSWVGSALLLGAIIASLPAGILMNSIGRRITLVLLIVPFAIGWLLIIFAIHIAMLITGRLILGMAAGATCVIIPMYIGEITQKEIRGALSSLFQLQITLGILFVYLVGAIASPLWINIICSMVPMIYAMVIIFLPDTPLFYMKKNKDEMAVKSFRWLHGQDYDMKPEMDAIREDIEQSKKDSMREALKDEIFLRAMCITVLLMVFQQASGITAIIFYTTEIFQLAGSTLEPKYCTIIVGAVTVCGTFVSMAVDKLGRRILLLISAALIVVSTLGIGVYYYEKSKDPLSLEDANWFPLAAICFYIIVYSIGYGAVPWILVGEVFPAETKGIGGALAAISHWLCAFIVAKSYPRLKYAIGEGQTFWMYSAFSVVALVFILFLIPETKNKNFVEIQRMLKEK